jgi:hypothetical protein
VKPLEKPVERIPPEIVGDIRWISPLERVRFEQSPIQERNGSEHEGTFAPDFDGLVESTKEERAQQIALDSAPLGETALDLISQEPFFSGEPAFCLYEVEEQDPGKLEQDESMPIVRPRQSRNAVFHSVEGGPELPEEAPAYRLGGECLTGACCKRKWPAIRRIRQPRERGE